MATAQKLEKTRGEEMADSAETDSSATKPNELDAAAKEVGEGFAKLKAAITVALSEWKTRVGTKETRELESRLVLALLGTPSSLHAVSTEGIIATSVIFRMHLLNGSASPSQFLKKLFAAKTAKEFVEYLTH
jgi:hypothetical protein